MPSRITLVSHAATAAVKRASFPLDEPLVDGEVERILSLRWVPPRAQRVLCGPELRTRQTAEALSLEASISSELGEVNYGSWQGKEVLDIQREDPEGLADWLTNVRACPHDGESLLQMMERVRQWMEQQVGGGHTVAVTHPAVVRAAILYVMQAPPESFWRIEIAPLSATDLRFNGRLWTVRSTGYSMRSS